MRIRVSLLLSVLCVLMMSAPAWARNLSSQFTFSHLTKIANSQLKPGQYRFIADESTGQVKVLRKGKVVAHVQGQWVNLKKKSEYSEVMSTRHEIQEVLFAGQARGIKFRA